MTDERGSRTDVLVIIGAGGMGQAIARRVGAGRRIVLADLNEDLLQRITESLASEGHDVIPTTVDVSSQVRD